MMVIKTVLKIVFSSACYYVRFKNNEQEITRTVLLPYISFLKLNCSADEANNESTDNVQQVRLSIVLG